MLTVEAIITALSLAPHPEGGFFRETFRDDRLINGRAASTAIYYLLAEGQRSHWHRIDASEIWHWYCGAPLALSLRVGERVETQRLGCNIFQGERPQLIVPAGVWQSAEPLGAWTLIGCTVAPGFEFSGFELAQD
jgi:predicted cupin superfamily sugar epimerase